MTFYRKDELIMTSEKWGMKYELRHQIYFEKFSNYKNDWWIIFEVYKSGLCHEWGKYKNGTYAKKVFKEQFLES